MTDRGAPNQAGRPTTISRDPIGTDPIGNNPLELKSPPQRSDGANATPGGWLKNATGVFIAVVVLLVIFAIVVLVQRGVM
ncbi:MAG: hypothetical protein U0Z70_20635 [Thermomicrobiales bacterium]|nr:hypothetical protein [Chloroflexia bacterium]